LFTGKIGGCLVIDWLTLALRVDSPLNTGSIASILPSGAVEWQSPKKMAVHRESWEANTMVWCKDGKLYVSGNPAKWLYGHNWYGPDDVRAIAEEWVLSVLMHIDHDWHRLPSPEEWYLTRIDINRSWQFASNHEVSKVIQALEKVAVLSHRGRGRFPTPEGRDTLYFGKNSRRWSLKFYNKWEEQRARGELLQSKLLGVAKEGILRGELTLRGLELESAGLRHLEVWDVDTVNRVFDEYLGRLEISAQSVSTPMMVLPPRLYGVYEMWQRGVVLRDAMSRASWYRARRELLAFGVDISSEPLQRVKEVEETTFDVPPISRWSRAFVGAPIVSAARMEA
jgi:II/X family phage/plasmid replication protein